MGQGRTIEEAMSALYPRTHGPDCADKYRAIATWWRLDARRSAAPAQCLLYARNQWKIAADMDARPQHHARMPPGITRWQWTHK